MVLGFLEMPKDEVPPEKYWHSTEMLKEWFAGSDQRRKDRAAGHTPIDDGDDENMMDNELAAGLRN